MKSPLIEWLKRLKRRPVLALPDEPEELPTLLRRIDTPGFAAAITGEQYFGLLRRNNVIVRLPLHAFTLNHADQGVRFLWIEFEGRVCRAMRLRPVEVEECARMFRPPELLGRLGHPLPPAGYVAVRLGDLRPGERFLTASGDVCQVAREQEATGGYVAVWVEPETVNTRKVLWPGNTQVFCTTPAKGHSIQRRVTGRRREEKRKGA